MKKIKQLDSEQFKEILNKLLNDTNVFISDKLSLLNMNFVLKMDIELSLCLGIALSRISDLSDLIEQITGADMKDKMSSDFCSKLLEIIKQVKKDT